MLEQKDTQCKERGFNIWWEDRSLPQKILLGIGFGICGIGFLAFFGFIVMLLWNWLMPDIFGLKKITYWQAWGLLVLCSILFKGFNFKDNNSPDRKRRKQLRNYIKEEQRNDGKIEPDLSEKL